MTAIYQRELRSYFHGMTGYVFIAFLLLFSGIYTMFYNLSSGYPNFEYVLQAMTIIFLIAIPILTMRVIAEERKIYKGVCINIDYYCGLLYKMLKIPYALYTPLFAIGRVVGWSAHRMEELINSYKIMRPAYPSLVEPKDYVPIDER